jgi:hypothetical protein
MMIKITGYGVMKQFSSEFLPTEELIVRNLPELLNMPKELAAELIVVRGHRKLNEDELIHDGEEVTLFLQIMGG